ncbi:uncharacterized protein M6B38_204400 [Iris pallida]|uniref:DUF547 domain-containing protein n=1 Tax=Iris pallida TaxID=29817 RepID=A0AAX6E7G3_IRIPA|nr:uncharacterized protein M6B38_204400 [Iris pallida]
MHPSKKLGGCSLREESPECSSPCCSMARTRRSQSVSEAHEDILNRSPRLSLQNPSIRLQRRLHYQNSLRNPEMSLQRSSSSSIASTETALQKPATELIKEIATLELEVAHMERYLLSLYRTAFDQYLTSSPTTSTANLSMLPSECRARSMVPDPTVSMEHQADHADMSCHNNEGMNFPRSLKENETRTINSRHIDDSSARHLVACSDIKGSPPREDPKIVEPMCGASHRSLAAHLGASLSDHVPDSPCKLSEDIIRCISAIYCKLSNPSTQQMDIVASPTPSVSSSSTFSPLDPRDSWSPQCHYEANASPHTFDSGKHKYNPYSGMVEVPRISIDGDRFEYASKMLNIFRSLIRRLETIDPRNMGYEEQLAFWINIHNALVMHAFLAYGLRQNQMKSTFSILKAAYNVGGHLVNAHVIQSSILRCQLHRPAVGIHSLFSSKRLIKGDDKHQYALSPPEPLVHFALCLGAYSDPALRVYRSKVIHQGLELAKEEFIQANISVQKETKIILPKILHYYAKDASMELVKLVEIVHDCVPEAQQKLIQGCQQRKPEKCVQWLPYKSSFRYIVHRDLAKQ